MKQIIIALFVLVAASFAAEVTVSDPFNSIDNQYIIIFKTDSTAIQRNLHLEDSRRRMAQDTTFANEILFEYDIEDFHGFSAKLSPSMLEFQKASQFVDFIEQDAMMHTAQSCSSQNGATWGLDRIADEELNLDGLYTYPSNGGDGVQAFILDTGIQINHVDFGGRAVWGENFIDNTDNDCNGHGTHVAGTVGGKTWGVAKLVTLIAVKVLDCGGSGSISGIVAGINWVVTQFKNSKLPSIGNMSLGGGKSTAFDNAVIAAINAGVTMVVAAGNDDNDACLGSPGNIASAIVVGATGTDSEGNNQIDNRAYFSNFGTCVSLFAPGLMIQSAWIGTSNSATLVISGTSMASPHVCGIACLYLNANPAAKPPSVKSWLLGNTVNNIIAMDCGSSTVCNNSPNRLAHSPC